jgi:molybdate transport system permease protein
MSEPTPETEAGLGKTREHQAVRQENATHVVGSSTAFIVCMILLASFYIVLIVLMLLANIGYLAFSGKGLESLLAALRSPEVRYAISLSLISCSITAVLALWVSVPIGYLMSRFSFKGKAYIDAVLDIPIVLPPLVVGISLLILFNVPPFNLLSAWVVYEVPAVILAQFMVASAFAVRTMRVTFDQIPQRFEQVALTLGASRSQAFWTVVLPQTRRGLLAAATLAWARALGEFGPILVFAGATSHRTEVLPTTVFLEMQAGNLPGMLAVSIIMVVLAAVVLVITRLLGLRRLNA